MSRPPKQPRQLIDSQDEGQGSVGRAIEGSVGRTILTDDHRLAIARLILENKGVINGTAKSLEIKNSKQRVWQEIFDHVISLGGVIPNVKHLRKVRFSLISKINLTQ